MAYDSVFWRPNYLNFGSGLGRARTWPTVLEQYRRPDMLHDNRSDHIVRDTGDKLYYRYPKMGLPAYRGTFRDKPPTVAPHYPDICPFPAKPDGFHGRAYFETGPPQFKYEGPQKDELNWLERNPYLSKPIDRRLLENPTVCHSANHLSCLLCADNDTRLLGCTKGQPHVAKSNKPKHDISKVKDNSRATRKLTQDGVGFL